MNLSTQQKQADRHRKQTNGYQRREGEEEGQMRSMILTDTHLIYSTNEPFYRKESHGLGE